MICRRALLSTFITDESAGDHRHARHCHQAFRYLQVVTVMRAEVQQPAVNLLRDEPESDELSQSLQHGRPPADLDRTLTGARSIMPRCFNAYTNSTCGWL